MLSRRSFLSGLIAAPCIVPVMSLMPLRGIALALPLLEPEYFIGGNRPPSLLLQSDRPRKWYRTINEALDDVVKELQTEGKLFDGRVWLPGPRSYEALDVVDLRDSRLRTNVDHARPGDTVMLTDMWLRLGK
jgi:hypothetical protein